MTLLLLTPPTPTGDGCSAYRTAAQLAYCGTRGYEASCDACCACAGQPNCPGPSTPAPAATPHGGLWAFATQVSARDSCEAGRTCKQGAEAELQAELQAGGEAAEEAAVACPAQGERAGVLAEPLNLATSMAGVLAGAMLLAPGRFVCCGVDPRAREPVADYPPE